MAIAVSNGAIGPRRYGLSWSPLRSGMLLSGSDDARVVLWDTNIKPTPAEASAATATATASASAADTLRPFNAHVASLPRLRPLQIYSEHGTSVVEVRHPTAAIALPLTHRLPLRTSPGTRRMPTCSPRSATTAAASSTTRDRPRPSAGESSSAGRDDSCQRWREGASGRGGARGRRSRDRPHLMPTPRLVQVRCAREGGQLCRVQPRRAAPLRHR